MTERKLATIRKIDELKPIEFLNKETGQMETADAIQLAIIDGWQCVVLKSEFSQPGEKCVYFEIDSIIPRKPWNMHIQKESTDKPIRLKTMKFKNVLSQGLALPFDIMKDYADDFEDGKWITLINESENEDEHYLIEWGKIGDDVTEVLGVEKYEPEIPAELAGQVRGSYPSDIPKTNQERVQNLPEILKEGLVYEVSEKYEGSSGTFRTKPDDFYVCSRNLSLVETEKNSFWKIARKYDLENKLRELGYDNLALQGELCGPGIQGNIYGLKEIEFFLFDVYDVKAGKYWGSKDRLELADKLGIKHVAIIHEAFVPPTTVAEVLEMAEGLSQLAKVQREGLVFKSLDGKVSWKAISNKYLLKQK